MVDQTKKNATTNATVTPLFDSSRYEKAVTMDYYDVILETQANNDPCGSMSDEVEKIGNIC